MSKLLSRNGMALGLAALMLVISARASVRPPLAVARPLLTHHRPASITLSEQAADADTEILPPADTEVLTPPRGLGWVPLASNLGVQSLYTAVAALGVTVLLSPFGGPSVFALLGLTPPWHAYDGGWDGPSAFLIEAALGIGVALFELNRQGVLASPVDEQLDYTPAQVEQMRPLYEISAEEPSLLAAAVAIGLWQLAIALAEECYYRGFVESAGVLALSYPLRAVGEGAGPLFVLWLEGVPLLASAALFGVVHTEFVEGKGAGEGAEGAATNADGVEDSKAYWFRVTAKYGALYSLLYVLSGHRVVAPTLAHAGMNVGLCLRDWRRMRGTPANLLRELFS